MVGRLLSMAALPELGFERDYGVLGRDLILNICIKVVAEILATVPAIFFTVLPRLRLVEPLVAGKQAQFKHGGTGTWDSPAPGCSIAEPCLASYLASTMIDSTASEEHNTCKVHDETLEGPNTSSRLRRKEINAWLVVAKNKDDDDDDEVTADFIELRKPESMGFDRPILSCMSSPMLCSVDEELVEAAVGKRLQTANCLTSINLKDLTKTPNKGCGCHGVVF